MMEMKLGVNSFTIIHGIASKSGIKTKYLGLMFKDIANKNPLHV